MISLPPLAAEHVFSIGSLSITNTYITSCAAVVVFFVCGLLIRASVRDVPRGIQNFFESLMELMLKYVDQVTRDRKVSLRYLPIVGSLFLFILLSNWLGLLPGFGSIGLFRTASGITEFIPILRPANTDLNLTLAMALLAVILSHVIGVATVGFFKYANKFIKLGDVWHAFASLNPTKILTAVIEFGVGLLEIISEVAKVISLSLRLFGNVFAGEVLITVLGALIAYIVPLPFMALELLVGFIQAMVFSMLALVYIAVAIQPVGHEESGEEGARNTAHVVEPI